MPEIRSDFISVYPFSVEPKGPVKLLVMRRRTGLELGDSWQFVHGKIEDGETAVQAAFRELKEETGFQPDMMYELDPEIIYYAPDDCVQIIPAFSMKMRSYSTPVLSHEHSFFEWVVSVEALNRVLWENQRNKINEIIKMLQGGFPSERFRIIQNPDNATK